MAPAPAPRPRTQTRSESGLTGTTSHSTLGLLPIIRRAQAKVVKRQSFPEVHQASGKQWGRKKSSDDRLAVIQAAHVAKEVIHIDIMTPHGTRSRRQTSLGSDATPQPAPKPLLACKAKSRAAEEEPPKGCEAPEGWKAGGKTSSDRLTAIEATHFSKEVAHIIAERARKTELGARRKGLKPPGTVRLSLNKETLSVSWAVEIGDFGSSILFDSNNKKDADAAGAIFAETHKKDLEGISAASLAMIPIACSDDSDIDNSECLMPRTYKGYYYNAQN